MSRFKTSIPVDVAEVIKQLPQRSYIEAVQLSEDRQTVDVVWGCDDLTSRYTTPEATTVADLEALRAKADAAREAKLAALRGSRDIANSQSAIAKGDANGLNEPNPVVVNDKVTIDTRGRRGRKAL